MTELQLLSLIPIVPLLAFLGVLTTGSSPNFRETITVIAGLVLLFLVYNLYSIVSWDNPAVLTLAEPFPGLSLSFTSEPSCSSYYFSLAGDSLVIPTTTSSY